MKMAKAPIMDEYICECGAMLRRRVCPDNLICEGEVKFCPFCGTEYEKEENES